MIPKKKVIILLLVVCIIGGGVFLIKKPKGEDGESKLREYTVVNGDIIVGIDGSGKLKLEGTEHYFNINGIIEEIAVKKGQKINEGDFIAKL
ncbi:MAG: hypothetical protein RR636_11240 [Clostridium sp.]|uniref:hypothetical protein n=1 Tax=Clostridium sp. TaxID=1506 RepID=UPI00304C3666